MSTKDEERRKNDKKKTRKNCRLNCKLNTIIRVEDGAPEDGGVGVAEERADAAEERADAAEERADAAEEDNKPVGYAHAVLDTSRAPPAFSAGTPVPPPGKPYRLRLRSRGRLGQSRRGATGNVAGGAEEVAAKHAAEEDNEEVLILSLNSDTNQKYF